MDKTKHDSPCVFPDIDYHAGLDALTVQDVSSVMLTFVRERAAFEPAMDGIHGLQELEDDILREVRLYAGFHDEGLLQDIFHKIQVWGGEHGRYIYVQGPVFDWNEIGPCYRRLVDAVLQEGHTPDSLASKAKAFNMAMQVQHRRLGLSFISKHVRFWSTATLGENALPIFDNIMSKGLGIRYKWENLAPYWIAMQERARQLGITVNALERELFNHFRETLPRR